MKFLKKISKKTAQAPGTLDYVGDKPLVPVRVSLLDYNESGYVEKTVNIVDESLPDKTFMRWLQVDGVHSAPVIEKLGTLFGLHPLLLEDIMHTGQRSKIENYDNCLFFVFKMMSYQKEKKEIMSEQVSLVVGKDYVISFQEKAGDVFSPVGNRIKNTRWREKKLGADYLAYTLLDAVVDHYFNTLEILGDQIELLEQELSENPTPESLTQIHRLKKEVLFMRKIIWPLRETLAELERNEYELIRPETGIYFKDVYDHVIQVMDTIGSFRDIMSGLQDLYMSGASNKMNEVMKVLTIIATLFIPPTFIAGIYGMNFENMPELKWHWGYAVVLGSMLALITGMLIYFKRKKWF